MSKDYMKAYMWYQVIVLSNSEVITFIDDLNEYLGDFSITNDVSATNTLWEFFSGEQNIFMTARAKISIIRGDGWFSFAKCSLSERNKARKQAGEVRASIPERQKNWKQ